MITIIPMAGRGTRFADVGYQLPKPLIPVSGCPMILQVVKRLPQSERIIFIVRPEHVESYHIDTYLKSNIPNAEVIIDPNPEGQAATCMHALKNIADDEEIFIAPCDSSQLYDDVAFQALRARSDVDAVVWTFTNDPLLTTKPTAWGWLKLAGDGETITDVSVKVPVSDDPIHDHAVTANFYFKRAGDFKKAYHAMRKANHLINNEYYVDAMPIFMQHLGKKSIIFDVDLYVSWGKPEDLYLYQQKDFQHSIGTLEAGPWRNYFNA